MEMFTLTGIKLTGQRILITSTPSHSEAMETLWAKVESGHKFDRFELLDGTVFAHETPYVNHYDAVGAFQKTVSIPRGTPQRSTI